MQRAVLVISDSNSDDEMSNIVWEIAETYGEETVTAVAWSRVDDLPDWVSVSLRDQLSAHRRDTHGSTYMLIWLGSDEEIESLTDDE